MIGRPTSLRRRSTVATLALLAAFGPVAAIDVPALAAPERASQFIGTYVATHVTGASVVRLELSLRADGRAQLRSGSSRYTQRPEAEHGGTTVQTGTWHAQNGRVVLHIVHSSSDTGAKSDAVFEDRTFVLAGCELQLVGANAAFTFDKQHCT